MNRKKICLAIGMLVVATMTGGIAVAVYRSHWSSIAERLAQPRPKPEYDVAFVPTPQRTVETMLELANVGKDDVLYDLGCGDGRILVSAAKQYGCRAVGFDIQQECVDMARENARAGGVQHLVHVQRKDIFTLDLSEADVVTLYLLPSLNIRLLPQLDRLKPGARVVSHRWDIAGVTPDKVVDMKPHPVYLWIAPLQHEGE